MQPVPKNSVEIWGGMECTLNRVHDEFFDQLNYSGPRGRDGDTDLFASLGLKKMRYPILWEHHQPIESQPANWVSAEANLEELRRHGVDIIAGLVHHGSGPEFVSILDDSFVSGLAQYAGQVAQKFPWINYYTPVNEPLTTARFCGLYGLWYPHRQDDDSFCRILVNECMATLVAMAAIRVFNPSAKLIQTDDLAKIHSSPALNYQAKFENERRWLSFDLLIGRVDRQHYLWGYLTDHGIAAAELEYFLAQPCHPDVMGLNYYLTSERYLDEDIELYPSHTHGSNGIHSYADIEAVRVGKSYPDGLQLLLTEAWDHFHIPIAVTEVHLHCTREEQMRWLNDVWGIANYLNSKSISIIAITPWALLGAFGWDKLLTCPQGTYEPGAFDISSGHPRPTILAAMIQAYSRGETFHHPALDFPGWWQRSCRVVYGEDRFLLSFVSSVQLLAISGTHQKELAQICYSRCLPFIDNIELGSTDCHFLATIIVDEYMEVNRSGWPDLVIDLTKGDLHQCINAGLDLLLDGETGYWETSQCGRLTKLYLSGVTTIAS
jgi:dTDP-4-dehydrorhamnose reductase